MTRISEKSLTISETLFTVMRERCYTAFVYFRMLKGE